MIFPNLYLHIILYVFDANIKDTLLQLLPNKSAVLKVDLMSLGEFQSECVTLVYQSSNDFFEWEYFAKSWILCLLIILSFIEICQF